ncbi:hypothetical protein [uncultured Roseobacter sp.]|uniref:hypothetical protein n=1 Tax=uncultured Roseobacter sp. TaxID=114847 RepID=UPI00263430BB|nr:hypothetical protein [uncultured Roseobacter sp.]
MTTPSTEREVWSHAELFLLYHRDRRGKKHAEPKRFVPTDAAARLSEKSQDRETCVKLLGHAVEDDVDMRLMPNRIMLVRETPHEGWDAVVVEQDVLRVRFGASVIRVNPDGGIVLEQESGTTFIEADGTILKKTHDTDLVVAGDGSKMSRRTEDQVDAFTLDGFVSRRK